MHVVVGSGSERTRSHLVQSRTGDGMSRKETYEEKTEAFLLPILEKDGFSLVDVEYVKEGGSTIFEPISTSRVELPSMTASMLAEK